MKLKFLPVFLISIVGFAFSCFSQVNFKSGSEFKYLKGNNAANLSSDWTSTDFIDAIWSSGLAPFRYGKGANGTLLSDMRNSYSTLYLRTTFTAGNTQNINQLTITADYDDGFIIWINGKEATRQNVPSTISNTALALVNHDPGVPVSFVVKTTDLDLNEGINTLAVQVFNVTLGSSDFYFDVSLQAQPELPPLDAGGKYVIFSHKAGFYSTPFDLTLSSTDSSLGIVYTIDGSNPLTSATRKTAGSTVVVPINPDNISGRGKTPAFIVRASLSKDGFTSSNPVANTFLFLEQVKLQRSPGGGWPTTNVNGQRIDYDMASDVVSGYSSEIVPALLQIPTISISTDLKNLFDPATGIYVNSPEKGDEWERDCSVELINPNGDPGFQINAGLRVRGGNSAKNLNNPKHAFRLFFREEYGAKKLKFPLFGDEGVSEFDCVDLRCEQNYSWSMDGDTHNTMVKDVFCRDLQGLMGEPYSKGRYYHLYLNGMYWGLFQTDERPESSFGASYLGGDKDDYDVIKVDTQPWPYYDIATDGNMDSWTNLWNLCQSGFQTNRSYFSLESKDENGNAVSGGNVLVDIDNLIDYMLVIFYSGNIDAPVSAWYGNDMPNNFFALFNRENNSLGYHFVGHDAEHCLFVENINGDGINENRANIGSNGQMRISNVLNFNPQWLHYKLCSNAEYRLRFADRAMKYLKEGGILSPEKTKALFKKRADQIETAVIAESARWGDAQTWPSRTKNDDWLPEINSMYTNYFPARTGIVVGQLKDEKLYSDYNSPDIIKSGVKITSDKTMISGSTPVSIQNSNTSGQICYTTDGTDPRLVGGQLSGKAITSSGNVEMNLDKTSVITARIKISNSWSPLTKMIFSIENQDYSALKVTELHYHPMEQYTATDTIDGDNFEFIEFKNTGSSFLDLSGLKLDSAANYTFPENTLLAPGAFYVVASKPNSFYSQYGVYPSGNYENKFNNGGEYVLLANRNGDKISSFTYDDAAPWPVEADGDEYTLTSVEKNPTSDPNDFSYWKKSSKLDGSPFANDDGIIDRISGDISNEFALTVFPVPTSESVTIRLENGNRNEPVNAFLLDLNGRLIYQYSFQSVTTINLKQLNINSGIYLLKIETQTGTQTRKVIYNH